MSDLTTTRIRVFSNRHPRSWEIPVSSVPDKDRPYIRDHRSAETIEKELLDLGFERVASVTSLSHYKVRQDPQWRHAGERPNEYMLWVHPAGVIARGHTYHTSNGSWQESDVREPVTTVETVDFTFAVEFPEGRERRHQSNCGVTGGGGVTLGIDGSSVRVGTNSVKPSQEGLMGDFLKRQQLNGRFLPLERWPAGHSVYLDAEFILPFPDEASLPAQAVHKDESLEAAFGTSREEAVKAFVGALPEKCRPLFERSLNRPKPEVRQWPLVEESVDQYTEALALAGKRWATDAERALLRHWSQVALGEQGEDVEQWRAFERGPAGLSLPVALLYARDWQETLPRLVKAIEEAPAAVANEWAAAVDKAGFTLPLRVLHRAFSTYTSPDAAVPPEALATVLTALQSRSALPLRWETPQRTPLGLVLECTPRYNRTIGGLDRDVKAFWETLRLAEGMGLVVGEDLRWRTHPNTMTDDLSVRDLPRWVSASCSTPLDALLGAMEKGADLESSRSVLARIRMRNLDRNLPEPVSTAQKPRF